METLKEVNIMGTEFKIVAEDHIPLKLKRLNIKENLVTGPIISVFRKLNNGIHTIENEPENFIIYMEKIDDTAIVKEVDNIDYKVNGIRVQKK